MIGLVEPTGASFLCFLLQRAVFIFFGCEEAPGERQCVWKAHIGLPVELSSASDLFASDLDCAELSVTDIAWIGITKPCERQPN